MSTPFLGLRTSIYKVNDIKKATAWYSDVLGIEPYFNEPFYVGFNVAGYELGLQPVESGEEPGGSAVTYWGVDDVQASFDRLLSKGATSIENPTDVGGGIIVGTVKDPWGNNFGIIYNPHFQLPS